MEKKKPIEYYFKEYRKQAIELARLSMAKREALENQEQAIFKSGLEEKVFMRQYLEWLKTLKEV